MTYSWISLSKPEGGSPSSIDIVGSAADDCADWLSSNNSHGHNFYRTDYADTGVRPGEADSEKDFIRRSIRELVDNNNMQPRENVVIAHGQLTWGYGSSVRLEYNNNGLW